MRDFSCQLQIGNNLKYLGVTAEELTALVKEAYET